MAAKTKEKKEPTFSERKNDQPPVTVKEDEEFKGSQQIVKIEKMDMPLATVEEAKAMWQQYQDLINALIKESDIVVIQDKRRVKKSGVNKIARFFGYSCEILRTKREDIIGPQGGRHFVWYAWVKAIAPNGRFRVEGAACSSTERRFAHLYHDVFAMAITRASNRAIQELAGMGELELTEEENSEEKPKTTERKTSVSGITEVGIDPTAWKPMYPGVKYQPANPKLPASKQALDWILKELTDIEIDPLSVIFMLGRKPNIREVRTDKLTKGDTFDIICAIKKKEIMKIIKEIPIDESPEESQNDGSIMS